MVALVDPRLKLSHTTADISNRLSNSVRIGVEQEIAQTMTDIGEFLIDGLHRR
jgi:hypothetical protein